VLKRHKIPYSLFASQTEAEGTFSYTGSAGQGILRLLCLRIRASSDHILTYKGFSGMIVPGNPDGGSVRDYRAQTIPENPSYNSRTLPGGTRLVYNGFNV